MSESASISLQTSDFRLQTSIFRNLLWLTASPLEQLLVQMLGAFVIEELDVLLEATIDDEAQFPRSREHFGIVDRRLVIDVASVHRREAFDDLERVAVEVSCLVEPGLVAQAGNFHSDALK